MTDISRMLQDTANQKMALQTNIAPVHAQQIWQKLVKNRPRNRNGVLPHPKLTFSDTHTSGDKQRFRLKI